MMSSSFFSLPIYFMNEVDKNKQTRLILGTMLKWKRFQQIKIIEFNELKIYYKNYLWKFM